MCAGSHLGSDGTQDHGTPRILRHTRQPADAQGRPRHLGCTTVAARQHRRCATPGATSGPASYTDSVWRVVIGGGQIGGRV